jgi:hypothetical protein
MSRPTTAADEGRLADMLAEEQVRRARTSSLPQRTLLADSPGRVVFFDQDSYSGSRPSNML